MKKILITGLSGFVGGHFLKFLEKKNIPIEVLGLDRSLHDFNSKSKHLKISHEEVDLLDRLRVQKIITDFKPDYILHLASFSSVAYSWKFPVESFQNNTNIFLNLIESVREAGLKARILSIGSSEEYGNLSKSDMPIKETSQLRPLSPYAVARVSQEMISKIYADSYGLDIVMTRSFNHIGPRQKEAFVVSSFAKQLVGLKIKGVSKGQIITGDISIIRDFLDVRDVVSAYWGLLLSGKKGEVYNVCSGKGVTLESVIRKMADILDVDIEIVVDKSLIRLNDNKIIIGSNEKIIKEIGWENKMGINDSLRDMIKYWKKELN